MALNRLVCAGVPVSNCSLTVSVCVHCVVEYVQNRFIVSLWKTAGVTLNCSINGLWHFFAALICTFSFSAQLISLKNEVYSCSTTLLRPPSWSVQNMQYWMLTCISWACVCDNTINDMMIDQYEKKRLACMYVYPCTSVLCNNITLWMNLCWSAVKKLLTYLLKDHWYVVL